MDVKDYIISLNDSIDQHIIALQNVLKMQVEKIIWDVNERVLSLQESNNNITKENDCLKSDLLQQATEIKRLQKVVTDLEEENKQFSKVSHIIAMEKENNRLKMQIQNLQAKLAITNNSQEDNGVKIASIPQGYREKNIKGCMYYISNSTGEIYIRNDDNSLGELKGVLEDIDNNKKKARWFSDS